MVTNNKDDCTGCHACFNICPQHSIRIESDSEGFLYPIVNQKTCIACGLCVKACPIINKTPVKNKPLAYACYNNDGNIRLGSSSGGIFTLIAEQVIDNGGIVFGAGFDKDFMVVHKHTENKKELEDFRGSKYVQSKVGNTYKQAQELLKQEKQVLFTGTPCQIAGLKTFLQKDYDNLLCVDIICHGVPSPQVWQEYVSYRENHAGAPARRIAFRRKDEGWKRYSVSFLFKNDTEYLQTLDKDPYMQAFLKNVCLRPSCYSCKFKTLNRQSDITLADFWGIQNVEPEMDDDKGTSLVFINTARGKSTFEKIKNQITYKEVDINKAVFYNSSAIKSVAFNPKRKEFFEELDQLPFDKLVKKYCSDSFMVQIKRKVMSVLKKTGLLSKAKQVLKTLDSISF